ncbi:ABC transporter substrate-binding protein [Zobellella endophytica]|uniref:ABC transporter substrate-binding protein n=1 Tax=Zobellella endophytica TaxID=2116700 RepID=A0A2P7R0Q4_9GAMM|nr:ABC transporter substrate-binding protein [Zobellella endophytica]PSJ43797.1 ABC transporter substrate-binding protein [Zobellella endophytica]
MNLTKTLSAAGLLLASQLAMAAGEPARVASFDHGSLDTLDALGLGARVVAVPKQALPGYLEQYGAGDYADAGGLRSPDLTALKAANPSLILITGRQGDMKEQLAAIAPVQDMSLHGDGYWESFSHKVRALAESFGAAEAAESALAELERSITALRAQIDGTPSVMVVTHNDGRYSLRTEPVVAELLGLAAPALPAGVESITNGNRTFTPLTPAQMAQAGPDALLVVDRSAAIGGEALDPAQLRQALDAEGGDAIKLTYLSPALWYLSGAGLQSVRLQAQEVAEAL